MKKIFIFTGVGLLIILLVIIFYQKRYSKNSNNQLNNLNKNQEIKDNLRSEITPPPIPFIKEDNKESEKDIVTRILAEKYQKKIEQISVNITEQRGNYIKGKIEIASGHLGDVGIFLATKEKGEWEIVFDGNGNPDCLNLKQNYNFPESILAGFCD